MEVSEGTGGGDVLIGELLKSPERRSKMPPGGGLEKVPGEGGGLTNGVGGVLEDVGVVVGSF